MQLNCLRTRAGFLPLEFVDNLMGKSQLQGELDGCEVGRAPLTAQMEGVRNALSRQNFMARPDLSVCRARSKQGKYPGIAP